jgi:hypothetical protein
MTGVVLLAKDGKAIFRQAYGMADLGLKVPNDPETKLNLLPAAAGATISS